MSNKIAFLFSLLLIAAEAHGQQAVKRQMYTVWYRAQDKPYVYRNYFFKPSSFEQPFQTQYVIFYPQPGKREWVYFFDPKSQVFWARYPTIEHHDPKVRESVLKNTAQWEVLKVGKPTLDEIKEDDWKNGKQGDRPPIPRSTDEQKMDCPPMPLPFPPIAN